MKNIYQIGIGLLSMIVLFSCTQDSTDESYNGYPANSDDYYATPESGENYAEYAENPFLSVIDNPESTFSVDADGASYANMRRFLYNGQTPPKSSVRIEEFLNYFTFDYDEPQGNDHVSLNSEITTCPWNQETHLMRIGMKGKTIPENELPNSNYVFLIDVSGSMNSGPKLGILKQGFKTMVDHLSDQDKVAIVTYAGAASVLLPSTNGNEKTTIKEAIDQLGAGGGTAGAEGIITAYEIAEQNFIPGGNNRIIIGSDGDFNIGPASTEELVTLIEEKRESGIYLTTLGVGSGNLNDHMMEQIANKGNGNYEYIDNVQQIQKVFVQEKEKFYTVAKDSKIQITFNPNTVNSYRLIGYENRSLNNEDFEDDTEDAGEIGSGQTITAIYEVALTGNNTENYAAFDFRYKRPDEEASNLISHEISGTPVHIHDSSDNMKFAASVTGFGLILRDSEYKGTANKSMVLYLSQEATAFDPNAYRQEFINIVTNWSE